jgi:hypothetical protein
MSLSTVYKKFSVLNYLIDSSEFGFWENISTEQITLFIINYFSMNKGKFIVGIFHKIIFFFLKALFMGKIYKRN